MKTISYTAQWTAAARAIEHQRPDRLCNDHLARILAAPKGFDLLKQYGGAGLQDFVAIRTHYFDQAIMQLTKMHNIRQVVMIAAGMDTRAYRLEWPAQSILYEIDYESLHKEKQNRLAQYTSTLQLDCRSIHADLSTAWEKPLINAGFNPMQPTLWIAEAIFFFFSDAMVQAILQKMGLLSAKTSYLIVDVLNQYSLKNIASQPFLNALKQEGIPWLFGTDDPEIYFKQQHWSIIDIKEPGEPGAGEKRWAYPVYPRDQRYTPRNWLIQAQHTN